MQILSRCRYDETHEKAGIRRLIADGTYLDCFSLHEGPYNRPAPDGSHLDRYLLYLIWARPSQWLININLLISRFIKFIIFQQNVF